MARWRFLVLIAPVALWSCLSPVDENHDGGTGGGSATGGGGAATGGGGSATGGGGAATGGGGSATGGGGAGTGGGGAGVGGGSGTGGGGVGGGGGAQTCDQLTQAYSTELQAQKTCHPNSMQPQCAFKAESILGCGCMTFVEDSTQLTVISQQWHAQGCSAICPGVACFEVMSATCDPEPTGNGTCTDHF